MPINADFFYQKAEQEFLAAKTTEEKIEKLQKMISAAPKHKGSENKTGEQAGKNVPSDLHTGRTCISSGIWNTPIQVRWHLHDERP